MMHIKKFRRAAAFLTAISAVISMNHMAYAPVMTRAALPFGLSASKDELMVGDTGYVDFYCYNAYSKGDECQIYLFLADDSDPPEMPATIAEMYDNGDSANGDRRANDGTYSCRVQIDTTQPGMHYYYAVDVTSGEGMTDGIYINVLAEFTEEDKALMQETNQRLDNQMRKCFAENISGDAYYEAMLECLETLQNEGLVQSYERNGYFQDVDGITFYYHTGKKGKTPPEIICVIPTEPKTEPITEPTTEPATEPTTAVTEPTENNLEEGRVYFSGHYQYMKNDTGITITACDRDVTGSLTVPAELDGFPVTAIGEHAFYLCATVEEIILPDSVKSIGAQAFTYCYQLKQVNIPDGVPEIADETFLMCNALESVNLPDSITRIGMRAFCECHVLETIHIPAGVTSFGTEVFQKCEALESINIPEQITEIPDNAFLSCTSLKEISLPEATARIGKMAFMLCNLDCITIRNKECDIDETFATTTGSRDTVFYGFTGSTADTFADTYGYAFIPLQMDETTEPDTIIEEVVRWGDADNNGAVDIVDVVATNKHILGREALSDEGMKNADINQDNVLSPDDSLNVMKLVVGLLTSEQCPL